MKTVCVIDGHPDPDSARYIHALCNAYSDGAKSAGHSVSHIQISSLDCPPMHRINDFVENPGELILRERDKINAADHVVLMFPLWLGSMPAATRAFFEQAARGQFFLGESEGKNKWPIRMMKGKSARIVITMGMPAFAYKALFRSASLKAVERGLFGISGFKPVNHTLIGGVDNAKAAKRTEWLQQIGHLGEQGI